MSDTYSEISMQTLLQYIYPSKLKKFINGKTQCLLGQILTKMSIYYIHIFGIKI